MIQVPPSVVVSLSLLSHQYRYRMGKGGGRAASIPHSCVKKLCNLIYEFSLYTLDDKGQLFTALLAAAKHLISFGYKHTCNLTSGKQSGILGESLPQ